MPRTDSNTLSWLTTPYGFPCDQLTLGLRPEGARDMLQQILAAAAQCLELPPGECIDIANADQHLRALYAIDCKPWFADFDGMDVMTLRGCIINFRACQLLFEPQPERRRQLGTHFAPPDARELVTDIGRNDIIFALHGCLMARVAEVLTLSGDTDGALAYTEEDTMSMYLPHSAHLAAARARGQAFAAAGDGAAATACLERSAAGAKALGLHMLELQAVLALGQRQHDGGWRSCRSCCVQSPPGGVIAPRDVQNCVPQRG